LGSEYLGKHSLELPVDPVLDLNYDALEPIGIPRKWKSAAPSARRFTDRRENRWGIWASHSSGRHPEAGHYYARHFSLSAWAFRRFHRTRPEVRGPDLAWGEAQPRNYVDNHYHKPRCVREEWNFAGLEKMASFGYALGQAAAQGEDIRWLPGMSLTKHGRSTDRVRLILMRYSRPSRFSGLFTLRASVSASCPANSNQRNCDRPRFRASDGSVGEAKATKGILWWGVEDSIKKVGHLAGSRCTFDITCDCSGDEPLASH